MNGKISSLKELVIEHWLHQSQHRPVYFHITHPQPEGFYPHTWCLFLPHGRTGVFVRGTTFWPDGKIWSEDFWCYPGHDKWRLATAEEIFNVIHDRVTHRTEGI